MDARHTPTNESMLISHSVQPYLRAVGPYDLYFFATETPCFDIFVFDIFVILILIYFLFFIMGCAQSSE